MVSLQQDALANGNQRYLRKYCVLTVDEDVLPSEQANHAAHLAELSGDSSTLWDEGDIQVRS